MKDAPLQVPDRVSG